jgi:hypothetical protein
MVTARSRALFALPAAAGALLLAGCGDPSTEPGNAPTTVAPSSVPPSSVPPGSTTAPGRTPVPVPSGSAIPLPPAPTDLPTASGRPVTVEGIVEEGVEPGCKVLTTGNTSYLILGGKDVPTGVRVRVEGVLQPGVLSTCQQGTPLRVTSIQRR